MPNPAPAKLLLECLTHVAEEAPAARYPEVIVKLAGEDGNAFMIMGRVAVAMRRAGIAHEEVDAYREEAMDGDYGNLLRVTMRWVGWK